MKWESSIYYTQFINAISTSAFTFNGQDSILYNGQLSQVVANQNQQKAFLYGASSNLKVAFTDKFTTNLILNYTYGRIKTDTTDAPLDHIPPLMARIQFQYNVKELALDFFVNYNGAKKLRDYNLIGEDNFQYATPDGMPAWLTLNLRASYKVHPAVALQAGIDNILDTQYRTFSSGINGAGRNIFLAIRANF
jgi:hemoglobin/transferrin/lactoferrin receptor protein